MIQDLLILGEEEKGVLNYLLRNVDEVNYDLSAHPVEMKQLFLPMSLQSKKKKKKRNRRFSSCTQDSE